MAKNPKSKSAQVPDPVRGRSWALEIEDAGGQVWEKTDRLSDMGPPSGWDGDSAQKKDRLQFLQHSNFYNTAISTTLQLFNWERRFTDIDFARQWRRGILRSTLAPGCSSKKQEYSRFGAREPERPIFAQKAGLVRASISPMYMGAGHLDLSSWI